MAFKVKRDEVYGDFKAIKRLDEDLGIYGCICIHCEKKRKFKEKTLSLSPSCTCQEPDEPDEVVQVHIDEGRKRLDKLRQALGKGVEEDESSETYSMFLAEVDEITRLLESADNEDGVLYFQKATLKMLVDLVPYAERQYRDDPRQSNAYAINALVTQIREITQDLNADNDQGALIESVMNSVLQPAFLQLGQILIDSMYALRKDIENDVNEDRRKRVNKQIDQTIRDMAGSFQSLFYDVKKRIAEQLM